MRKYLVLLAIGGLFFSRMSWAEEAQSQQMQSKPLASEFAKGVVSPVLSVVYFPVKFSVGVAGAILGGVSGWMTGGNIRAAEGIWRPTVGGTYFITPQVLDREHSFLPFDGGEYAQWPRNTVPPSGPMYSQP